MATMRSGLATVFLLTFASVTHAEPAGLWRERDGGTIRVYECDPGYCAEIVSVVPTTDPKTGAPATDRRNPDPTKRTRPLVGVSILTDTKPDGPNRWAGRLYDCDHGRTFPGRLVEVDEMTIRLEGCAGSICGGEELTRVK